MAKTKQPVSIDTLPEIKEAVQFMAERTRTIIIETLADPTLPPSNAQQYSALLKNPKMIAENISKDPYDIKDAAMFYALNLMEKAPALSPGAAKGVKTHGKLAATAKDLAVRIRDEAIIEYNSGKDVSELAKKAAIESPKQFITDMQKSLLRNPETIELMNKLPQAVKLAQKKQLTTNQ